MGSVIAFGVAELVTFLVAWAARRYARMMAVAVIFASQVWGLVAQEFLGDFSPLRAYAAIDLATVLFLTMMAVYWHRGWLLWVASCYAVMVGCHAIMAFRPIPEAAYIWLLNGLGFLALAFIIVPPLWELIRGHKREPRRDFGTVFRGGSRRD
jgi:hypothetical protein